jgi:hypothetical protein
MAVPAMLHGHFGSTQYKRDARATFATQSDNTYDNRSILTIATKPETAIFDRHNQQTGRVMSDPPRLLGTVCHGLSWQSMTRGAESNSGNLAACVVTDKAH